MTRKVHFIGIGGIGLSSLAQYYLAQGWRVSGSDAARSEITDDLKRRGVRIFIGQRASNLKNVNLVIYSAAIRPDDPELSAALKSAISTQSYAQAVGELTKKYFTVAIAGSHGKSTTTALIGLIMIKAGLDPTIIIGTKLRELGGSNFRLGKNKYLVLEADEYARSFHNYFPRIAVVTNIDKEHLDTYKNLAGVLAGFKKFFGNISVDGYLVANAQDINIKKILNPKPYTLYPKIVWYGRGRHDLVIPGIHNQFNAEAAWQAVKLLGVKKSIADKVFKSYQGAWRRLELLSPSSKFQAPSSKIYSDYAHHPTEIRATLQALREKYPNKKIICIFQPHQQDRLTRLFKEFTQAFKQADKIVLYPLYKVKGRDSGGKTSEDLSRAIKQPNVFYAASFGGVVKLLEVDLKSKAVIVFMSAGDLDGKVRRYFGAR
ncbi:MAG: UDP-N-acetylmuramate--L-alanine ligase [Parcubacteria group bacterium]|nr:UDP-N-acetylmuramate--L-alanine ligase [Parcubacteria group bacterium]